MGSPYNTVNPFQPGVVTPDSDPTTETPSTQATLPGSGGSGGGMFRIVGRGTSGLPLVEIGPAVRIGPKDVVTVSPDANNTSNVYFSTTCPTAVQQGPRVTFPSPGLNAVMNSRVVRVRNLNEIFMASDVAGEALLVDVQWHG